MTAPPRTQASVYSRALELQERLVRSLDNAQFRWMLSNATSLFHLTPLDISKIEMMLASVKESDAGYVNSTVCSLILDSMKGIPDVELRAEQLPTPNGFFMLEQPFRLPVDHIPDIGKVGPVRAISWRTFHTDDRHRFNTVAFAGAGIFISIWANHEIDHPSELRPVHVASWGFGQRLGDAAVGKETDEERLIAGAALCWLAALLAFCEQRLIATPRGRPERATRRRIERSGREPSDVLVVELRRVDQLASEPSGGAREWSCSWAVSGHWRHQWYASKQAHRAIWISPYIKGDLDKPLRQRRRVLAVVQ